MRAATNEVKVELQRIFVDEVVSEGELRKAWRGISILHRKSFDPRFSWIFHPQPSVAIGISLFRN